MSPRSPRHEPLRPPHPLALELIARLKDSKSARVLEIGRGSGRNAAALDAAGYGVGNLDAPEPSRYDAALSTHALLHGTPQSIALLLTRIATRLHAGGPLYATFGSVRDARYREGTRIEEHVFAPVDGDERGVPHAFFDEVRLREMLEDEWIVESMREIDVDAIAGSWAHQLKPLERSMHWFVVVRRR